MAGITEPERAASQRELDILRERVDAMDTHGTRGTMASVGILQAQMTEIVKDLSSMAATAAAWQEDHERGHQQERRDRASARRWLVGIGIAGLASMAAVITLLLDIASRVHH